MTRRFLFDSLGAILLSVTLLCGCSVSLSGSASLNADGTGAVLRGADPILVAAKQPELPPPPPPPPPKPVRKAKVVGKKIEITEKVMFDYNKATIKPESNDLLSDVAKVLAEHAGITKVRVEGHTDSDGSDKYNKKLSQKRAEAVREFLVQAGIDATRLEAVGYGEERPIASNDDEEGKEMNRRVEFNILAQKETKEIVPVAPGDATSAEKQPEGGR